MPCPPLTRLNEMQGAQRTRWHASFPIALRQHKQHSKTSTKGPRRHATSAHTASRTAGVLPRHAACLARVSSTSRLSSQARSTETRRASASALHSKAWRTSAQSAKRCRSLQPCLVPKKHGSEGDCGKVGATARTPLCTTPTSARGKRILCAYVRQWQRTRVQTLPRSQATPRAPPRPAAPQPPPQRRPRPHSGPAGPPQAPWTLRGTCPSAALSVSSLRFGMV